MGGREPTVARAQSGPRSARGEDPENAPRLEGVPPPVRHRLAAARPGPRSGARRRRCRSRFPAISASTVRRLAVSFANADPGPGRSRARRLSRGRATTRTREGSGALRTWAPCTERSSSFPPPDRHRVPFAIDPIGDGPGTGRRIVAHSSGAYRPPGSLPPEACGGSRHPTPASLGRVPKRLRSRGIVPR